MISEIPQRKIQNLMAALPIQYQAGNGLSYVQYAQDQRYVRTERRAEDYQGHTLHTHIYAVPDTYIGSVTPEVRPEYVYDFKSKHLSLVNVQLARGYIRPYLEILSNAGDNVDASRRFGTEPGRIEVTMDRKTINIRSYGEPIPVVPKPELSTPQECRTLVDFIFGQLLTSSNYDKRVISMGCGKNGYGAKLCNVFSKYFRIKVGDPKRGQEHESLWTGNMTQHAQSKSIPGFRFDPTAEGKVKDGTKGAWVPYGTPYRGPAYVEVTWVQDFARFGYTEHPDEAFGLFARYLIDFSLTCKIIVSFNNEEIDVRSIKDYAKLFWTVPECATSVTHYEWGTADRKIPPQLEKLKGGARDKKIAECPNVECIPIVEVCILDTPDRAICLSFVNGLMTMDGGVHVNEAYKVLSAEILESINQNLSKRSKGKKEKSDKKKEAKVPHLTPGDVKPHVSMIINCRLPDPGYTSQSKTELREPKPLIKVGEPVTKAIAGWSLIERLYATLEAKMFKSLAKTDGKKKRHVYLEKGEDANDAGGSNSSQCILYLIEGKSASSYPKKRITETPGGKDYSGYYPLKGKLLNVTNADYHQLQSNEEIAAIKKMLGLQEGITYDRPADLESLRYRFVLSATDADVDGVHIRALCLNLFHKKWPGILRNGMFGFLLTPAVRVFDNKKIVARFPTARDYEKWEIQHPNHGYRVKFYKGLGTHRDDEIKDDLVTAPLVVCVYDDKASDSLDLAFDKKNADARKLWIQRCRELTKVDDVVGVPLSGMLQQRPITSIINHDLIEYTLDALFRAIASYKDGLKIGQRQALYYILHRWKYGHSREAEEKVSQIANAAAAKVRYHHGEKNMMDTIIKMAQNFVGSNNLNVLCKDGQFGTRDDGGADAADGRYSETKPEWWIKYAFNKDLIDLVPKRKVEGKDVEPYWLPCDVPIHVINGTLGIATGHSTFIPCHNPYSVILWLVEKCQGKSPKPLEPWYHGFTGSVTVVQPKKKEKEEVIPPEEGEEVVAAVEESEEGTESVLGAISVANGDRIKGISMRTQGKFEIVGRHADGRFDVRVTELPIGKWLSPYRKWLEEKRQKKEIIDFRDNSSTEKPCYTITGWNHKKGASTETLHLQKSFGLSNINLIDDQGYPFHFQNIQQVMETYFQSMVGIYGELIRNQISTAENELVDFNYQLKFIQLVRNEEEPRINVHKQSKLVIWNQMDIHQIPRKYLEKIRLYDCTPEEVAALEAKILAKLAAIEEIRKQTPQGLWTVRLYKFHEALREHGYA